MSVVIDLTQRLARSSGDPRVQDSGPGSRGPGDGLAHALGWFSLGLGVFALVAPGRITGAIGLEGKEGLVRACGAREILTGIPTLSMDRQVGLAGRVAGDVLDMAVLLPALRAGNPRRGNAALALAAIGAVTLLDLVALAALRRTHGRGRGPVRDYGDRSGLPRGLEASRGLASTAYQGTGQRRDAA